MLRPRLLLRRLWLMPRQIRKSPGALKVVTAQPRVDVPTEKRGYHCSMRRRGYRRPQRRIAGAILTGKQSCQVPPRHQFLSRNSHQNSHKNRVRSRRITMFCSVLNSRVQPLHSQDGCPVDYRNRARSRRVTMFCFFFLFLIPPPHPPNAPTPVLSLEEGVGNRDH